MAATQEQIDLLSKPLNPERIRQREQAGRQLSYIESWDAIQTGNRIFGYGSWATRVQDLVLIGTYEGQKNGKTVWMAAYKAVVSVTAMGTTFDDVGFGIDTSYQNPLAPHELAQKEAVSDAEKRALRHFGDQFGLTLYDKQQRGVGYDEDDTPAPAAAPKTSRKKAEPAPPKATSDNDESYRKAGLLAQDGVNVEEGDPKALVEYMQYCMEHGVTQEKLDEQLAKAVAKYGAIPDGWAEHMLEQAKLRLGGGA